MFDALVVDAGDIGGRDHPDDSGDRVGGGDLEALESGVRVLGPDGVGVKDAGEASDEVVGVEGGPGDVAEGALMVVGFADDGVGGALGEMAHRPAS